MVAYFDHGLHGNYTDFCKLLRSYSLPDVINDDGDLRITNALPYTISQYSWGYHTLSDRAAT